VIVLIFGGGFIVGVFFGIFTTALLVAGHRDEEE
jgi:hypothetical protein